MRGDDLLVLCLLTQDVDCTAVLVVVGVFLGPHVESHLFSVMAFATAVTCAGDVCFLLILGLIAELIL